MGYYTSKIWRQPEAQKFRRVAIERGVDPDAILTEDQSRNSGENVIRTRKPLDIRGITLRSAICVQKPYLERRVHLPLKKQWPDCDFLLTSPPIQYEHYPHPGVIEVDKLINELVGQVDRVEKYPSLGFTERDELPEKVLQAKSLAGGARLCEAPRPGPVKSEVVSMGRITAVALTTRAPPLGRLRPLSHIGSAFWNSSFRSFAQPSSGRSSDATAVTDTRGG